MAINPEDFRSAGVLPTGPVSAWPKSRNDAIVASAQQELYKRNGVQGVGVATKMNNSPLKLAKNLAKTAKQAVTHGKVSKEIREERYDTCKACPMFDAKSKRCKDCGCFMEAKTWVGGRPEVLCPQNKWSR